MKGWIEMCEFTKKKLDRELIEPEIDFIKWVCDKHQQETEKKLN